MQVTDRVSLDVVRPLSHAEAEQLVSEPASTSAPLEQQVRRARALRHVESYDLAWADLISLELAVGGGTLRARIRTELMVLSYYLARRIDAESWSASILREAAGAPAIIAEMRQAVSVRAMARNEGHVAVRELLFAFDAARAIPHQEDRRLIELRLHRVAAHVHAQTGNYRDGAASADWAITAARELSDEWETAWALYTKGFVLWCSGRPVEALEHYVQAQERLGTSRSSLARWVVHSTARVDADLGDVQHARERIALSSYQLPEDIAYVALVAGEPQVASEVLRPHMAAADPFVLAVAGIVGGALGDPGAGSLLSDARLHLASGGLWHYVLALDIHLAYLRDHHARGAGRRRALAAALELRRRGADGFAWPYAPVSRWLSRQIAREESLRAFGLLKRRQVAEFDAIQVLIDAGLTEAEGMVAQRLMSVWVAGTRVTRKDLAADFGVAPNTLRVHIHRIRSKLGIEHVRGDRAVAEAIDRLLVRSSC